jgi:hypothetical protein
MNNEEFRAIPGYNQYGVTRSGVVKSFERDLILRQYWLDSYLIVDAFRGSLTETLPVHRAVALAWVGNPDSTRFTIVNHRDGNRANNWFENLEWTDYSGNNYHAVNNGLRLDNIPCRVRDFQTGEVFEFSSMAQAAEFMGLSKDTPHCMLRPKMFGKLVADRYEFRQAGDPEPWFYENRKSQISPARYMVEVIETDGSKREVFSTKALLKEYQLYDAPQGKSILALASHGNQLYPDRKFNVRDSYAEATYRKTRKTEGSVAIAIQAQRNNESLTFDSLTRCASHFGVDRSSITARLNNGKALDGWTFTNTASLASDG